jgi:hypothetical protein
MSTALWGIGRGGKRRRPPFLLILYKKNINIEIILHFIKYRI